MSEYGQNVPYAGQQQDSSNLVDNPRYQGQSTGTLPQGTTGPQQESRYGAAPLSSAGNNDPMDSIRNPAAYGFKKHEPEGFRFPGTQQQGQQHGHHLGAGQGGYGTSQTTGGYGSDPNAQAGYGSQATGGYGGNPNQQAGYGSQTTSGYGSHPSQQAGYGSQATGGYGADPSARGTQTGYGGQPTSGGYGTERAGVVDPNTRTGQAGYGSQPTGGYGTHHQQGESEFAKEQPGYGQPGFGAPSEGQHTGSLWPQPATPPNAHQHDLTSQGQGGYGHQQPGQGQGPYGQQQSGQGQGPYGQGGYDQAPRKEGIVDKVKDAVGVGPRSHGAAPGQEYNPNVNHPSEGTGFGGGHGHHTQGGHDQLGGGYNTGLATGADAYTQSQPRKEGIVDKAKDAVGVGPNSGYDARTHTGNDAYVHGNHPPGMQDRVQGVNEPSFLGGEHAAGRRDGVRGQGEHIPESLQGETRTEPGYDTSKGHLTGYGGHHQKVGETGLGSLPNVGTDERRGKGYGDSSDPYDSKLGTGTGTGTGTDTGTGTTTGADTYGGTTGTGYDDTTGSDPPKKGLISKIKDKLHH